MKAALTTVRILWLVAGACALADALYAVSSRAAPAPSPFVIHYNPGGFVEAFVNNIESLDRKSRPVEVRGFCASACTMYLGVKAGACVAAESVFMFHGAYDNEKDPKHSQDAGGSAALMSYYPKSLREFITRKGGLHYNEIWVHGSDLIAIGAAKECAD